jgi:hypothetical protein
MTTKRTILRTIRAKCIDCCGGSKSEVANCVAYACPLHPFRFGRDPLPDPNTGFARSNAYASDLRRVVAPASNAPPKIRPP